MPRSQTEDLRTRTRVLKTSTEEKTARDSAQEMEEGHLTTLQKRAVVLARQIEIFTGPDDSACTRIKEEIISDLRDNDLGAAHPSNPGSLDESLQDYGVRKSELSDLMVWENHIYPYLAEHWGLKPVDIEELLTQAFGNIQSNLAAARAQLPLF